jgi:hypothetical protein
VAGQQDYDSNGCPIVYPQGTVGTTNGEVVSGGVNLVPYTAPPAPPTAPTAAPTFPPSQAFGLVSGTGNCAVSSDGACITDGSGTYANNAMCVWRVLQALTLVVNSFSTEAGFDSLSVCDVSVNGVVSSTCTKYVQLV